MASPRAFLVPLPPALLALVLLCSALPAQQPAAAAAAAGPVLSAASAPFPNFESGPVRPLLLSADGQRLFVLNTPDHRVEVFDLLPASPSPGGVGPKGSSGGGPGGGAGGLSARPSRPAQAAPRLHHSASVFVGLEPVSMALHPDDPDVLFVSNHVSDTVSVVDLVRLQVAATLPVGDEPRGLLVTNDELYVACAQAPATPPAPGQLDPGPFDQHVVAVWQASPPYGWLAHVPVNALRPRGMTLLDGVVYLVPLDSSNHTTLLNETQTTQLGMDQTTPDAFDPPFAVNPVLTMPEIAFPDFVRGWTVPTAGRVVFDWEHPGLVPQLPDRDVIAIDPASHAVLGAPIGGVATTLLDIEANPFTGDLWVVGTEARNRVRFEPNLRAAALENRVVIVDPATGVSDTLVLAPPFTAAEHAQPVTLAFGATPDGPRAYVAALGTATVLVLDALTGAPLEAIATGPMPSGLAHDPTRNLLHVFCRGDKTLRSYEARAGHATRGQVSLPYDPEPRSVTRGRLHLYDASPAQGHGTGNMSCASCHVFGHGDALAWDLGDPGGSLSYYYPDVQTGLLGFGGQVVADEKVPIVHPMKGPMVTQSLRGLMDPATHDDLPLHWRGDRRVMQMFRGAFQSLLGGAGISPRAMQEFTTFVRSIRYAPNPFQPRDRVYAGLAADGRDKFGLNPAVPGKPYNAAAPDLFCASCHQADFEDGTDFTGSRPTVSAGSFTQLFNTAQLRMVYEKDFRHLSGFGALHDGAVDGVRGFMDFVVPNGGFPTFPNFTLQDKDDVAGFAKQWDSGLSPLVGAQLTMDATTVAAVDAFLDLAEAQASLPEPNLDLIAKGWRALPAGTLLPRGAVFAFDAGAGEWGYLFDTGDHVPRSVVKLFATLDIGALTFTCVPPGLGTRLGVDRDEDGLMDFLELGLGTAAHRADTDGDGYTDGAELALGGDPRLPDETLPDSTPPAFESVLSLEVSHRTATVQVRLSEPALVTVALGLQPGPYDLASFAGDGLRRWHDLVLDGLPAGTELFYEVTATDRNGLQDQATGSFTTLPPLVHVQALSIALAGTGPFTATATALVHDHLGQPVVDAPVRAFWSGDRGGLPFRADARTDATGTATFVLGPFTPAGPTTLAFSPAYVGSVLPSAPWFVGLGGDTPSFFYLQPDNQAHYVTVAVP